MSDEHKTTTEPNIFGDRYTKRFKDLVESRRRAKYDARTYVRKRKEK